MKMILIVENELLTAARMQLLLAKSGYTVTISPSGEKALEFVKTNQYDAVLMDIHLDGKIDGITAARSIKKLCSTPIIFITELDNEEIFKNAKEIFPQNYITKPFTDNSLLYAVELAINNAEKESNHINTPKLESFIDSVFIPVVGGYNVKLLFNDILYIKANGAYSDIYYDAKGEKKDNFYKISLSSNHVVEQLKFPALVKVNRSYHVNIKKIEKFQKSSIFIQGQEIAVSDEYNNILKKMLLFFKY